MWTRIIPARSKWHGGDAPRVLALLETLDRLGYEVNMRIDGRLELLGDRPPHEELMESIRHYAGSICYLLTTEGG